jgi:2-oxoglutarate dehydrogenase E1 component
VLWEAQFGDFVDGAQTVLDEFVSSGEQKWGQRSGVTLLLPHGYEGQGPDHSSARVERFLSMCAQDNMTVAIPTTPASYFHLLRWQALSGRHKPLIVFTPKSMLRLKAATSAVADFTQGSFRPVIGDPASANPAGVRAVLLCAGKIYYDLASQRAAGRDDIALIRVERLYPLPLAEIIAEVDRYPAEAEIAWVQEEPANMGAWPTMALWLPGLLERPVRVIAPQASSAPALGSSVAHAAEHKAIIQRALSLG